MSKQSPPCRGVRALPPLVTHLALQEGQACSCMRPLASVHKPQLEAPYREASRDWAKGLDLHLLEGKVDPTLGMVGLHGYLDKFSLNQEIGTVVLTEQRWLCVMDYHLEVPLNPAFGRGGGSHCSDLRQCLAQPPLPSSLLATFYSS